MRKVFFAALIFTFLLSATPALAKITDNPFLAAILKIVQDIMPGEEMTVPTPEEMDEEFVDPREVQQVLREIKDMRRELNRFIKELKKLANTAEDINQINGLLESVSNFETKIKAGEDLRETIQEFRDAQIWQEIQKFRAKIEIPREMKQWNLEIKRIEKLLKLKKVQSLTSDFGLNLEGVKVKLDEIKVALAAVQDYYNSGDLESAIEEFDGLRQDFHPGEINSVLQRMQDLAGRLKAVKDKEIKNQIKETLAEVVSNFNEGEYRIARELMDENFNELTKLIYQASSVGKKKGLNKQNWMQMMEKLEIKMKEKGEEKEQIKEMRVKPEEMPSAIPSTPSQPPQPLPVQPVPTPPVPTETPTTVPVSPPAPTTTPEPTPQPTP